jgi:hypothetical protein
MIKTSRSRVSLGIRSLLSGTAILASFAVACKDPCVDDGFVAPGSACRDASFGDNDDDMTSAHDDSDGDGSDSGDDSGDGAGESDSNSTGSDSDASEEASDTSDESSTALIRLCADTDGDGFGDPDSCMDFPSIPASGWVENDDDCDDTSAQTFPGAAEFEEDPMLCRRDEDQDGYGESTPSGTDVAAGTDCDDADVNAFPGAAANESTSACMKDSDGDDWGDEDPTTPGVIPGTDCDDTESATYRGAAPLDDEDACMTDADNDDYGDLMPSNPAAVPGTDCLDTDNTVYPGAASAEGDACMQDSDGDGWGDNDPPPGVVAGNDCDDASASTFPGAAPKDDADACMKDEDGDDFGDHDNQGQLDVEVGTDCDDDDVIINPDHGDDSCLPALALDLPANLAILNGESIALLAVGSGGSGNYTWSWAPSASLSANNVAQPLAMPSSTHSYTVTLTDTVTAEVLTKTVTVHVTDEDVKIGSCAPGGIFDLGGFEINAAQTGGLIKDASWISSDAGQTICQVNNNQPSAVMCTDWLLYDAKVTGSFTIDPDPSQNAGNADDDWTGFIWGVQPGSEQYYFFSWKAKDQNGHAGCGTTADFKKGMYVKRIDQAAATLNCRELLSSASADGYVVLAQPASFTNVSGTNLATNGWQAGATYVFELEHHASYSVIRVRSEDSVDQVEIQIDDDTYEQGYFGVFSVSQDHACFSEYTTEPN